MQDAYIQINIYSIIICIKCSQTWCRYAEFVKSYLLSYWTTMFIFFFIFLFVITSKKNMEVLLNWITYSLLIIQLEFYQYWKLSSPQPATAELIKLQKQLTNSSPMIYCYYLTTNLHFQRSECTCSVSHLTEFW